MYYPIHWSSEINLYHVLSLVLICMFIFCSSSSSASHTVPATQCHIRRPPGWPSWRFFCGIMWLLLHSSPSKFRINHVIIILFLLLLEYYNVRIMVLSGEISFSWDLFHSGEVGLVVRGFHQEDRYTPVSQFCGEVGWGGEGEGWGRGSCFVRYLIVFCG